MQSCARVALDREAPYTQTQWGATTRGSQAWAVGTVHFSGLKAISVTCMLRASPSGPIHWGCGRPASHACPHQSLPSRVVPQDSSLEGHTVDRSPAALGE